MSVMTSSLSSAGAGLQRASQRGWQACRKRAHLPARQTEAQNAHPPEVVAEWQRVTREIAHCPHEDEDMAWVESVSILFEEE